MKLARALRRLTQSWWQIDKLRASPDEGLLLRLTPPCYLRLAGETLEVFNRRRLDDHAGVAYDCRSTEFEPHSNGNGYDNDDGYAELRVLFAGLREPPALRFYSAGRELALDIVDVQVFENR